VFLRLVVPFASSGLDDVVSFCEFRPMDAADDPVLQLGALVPWTIIEKDIKDKKRPVNRFFLASQVQSAATGPLPKKNGRGRPKKTCDGDGVSLQAEAFDGDETSNPSHRPSEDVVLQYNKERKGWHYSWCGGRHKKDRHTLRFYVGRMVGDAFEVLFQVDSPSFSLYSGKRRHDRHDLEVDIKEEGGLASNRKGEQGPLKKGRQSRTNSGASSTCLIVPQGMEFLPQCQPVVSKQQQPPWCDAATVQAQAQQPPFHPQQLSLQVDLATPLSPPPATGTVAGNGQSLPPYPFQELLSLLESIRQQQPMPTHDVDLLCLMVQNESPTIKVAFDTYRQDMNFQNLLSVFTRLVLACRQLQGDMLSNMSSQAPLQHQLFLTPVVVQPQQQLGSTHPGAGVPRTMSTHNAHDGLGVLW
jgi:hypothetical protein